MVSLPHATSWEPRAARAAPAAGHRAAEPGTRPVGRRRHARLCRGDGVPVACSLSQAGCRRTEGQTDPRPPLEVERAAAAGRDAAVAAWRRALRLLHRPVDHAPGCGVDPEEARRRLPPQSPLAAAAGLGLELPEAGNPGPGAERRGHRSLEAVSLAPYKKTPQGMAPIWRSSMRAASCWRRPWSAPGRPADRPRCCAAPDTGPRSRP